MAKGFNKGQQMDGEIVDAQDRIRVKLFYELIIFSAP